MRKVKKEESHTRKKKILQAAVTHYIRTDKPVSSRVICNAYDINLSSATVRNLISSLEKEGYLKHPHTSSGCIPTDKGYRFFVDSLVELRDLALKERRQIMDELRLRIREIDTLLIHTSHLLSAVSSYMGFVLEPKLDKTHLRNIELIKVSDTELLVLLITMSGIVKHQIIDLDFNLDESMINDINQLLNEKFHNATLYELKVKLPDIIDEIKQRKTETEKIAAGISGRLLRDSDENVYLQGTGNIMSMLKKTSYDKVCSLMHLIEHKKHLARILEDDFENLKNTRVTIGREHSRPELEDLSLVKTTYKIGNKPIGILGIMGPKRMEYSKMISLVNFIANIVNGAMDRMAKLK